MPMDHEGKLATPVGKKDVDQVAGTSEQVRLLPGVFCATAFTGFSACEAWPE